MAETIREQILTRLDGDIAAALATDGGQALTHLERSRQRAVDDAARPAWMLAAGGEERAGEPETQSDDIAMTVDIWGFVTGSPDGGIETAVNELYGRLLRAAMADIHIGGLADDIRFASFAHDLTAQGQARTADCLITLNVIYRTAPGDPFSQ